MGLSLPCAVRDMRCCAGRHVELINYGELINHIELISQQFLQQFLRSSRSQQSGDEVLAV